MEAALFYDTETTGLPVYSSPSEDPNQPHIVQLAAMLVNLETREILQKMDVIIRPDGWTIPEEVTAIHGISTDHAISVGIPEEQAIDMLLDMWDGNLRIGHNEQFDSRIIRIGLKRFKSEELAEAWKQGSAECTGRLARPIYAEKMRAVGKKNKMPKLSEAYQCFMGEDFENAHSALADATACMKVYFAIKDLLV
jgi:DNA polymerase-3 subunit epsilon